MVTAPAADFFRMVAPAGTPAPIVVRLSGVFIAAEMRKWTEIVAAAGIKID